jgi:serine/threonine protein kinase/tetratricopeptide (TPR) repeat protein
MTLAPGTRLGHFEILAPIGTGGMGEVYRARDTRLGREVAIKVLPASFSSDPDRLRRFEQEARAASALNHPNIVTVYDVGQADPVSYTALELVVGETLREILTAGPLPLKRALSIAAQVADGLAKAHAAGIVHRDLKPENVMVSKDGFAKILDFGLAKLTQPEPDALDRSRAATLTGETEPGVVLGTVGYMSPEQASGRAVDFHSDQFSFGAILYEMVAGKRAFAGASSAETLAAIIRDEPLPLASLNPKAPAPLRWIVDRCLAKDREERYGSTRDLARDLQSLREHLASDREAEEIRDQAEAAPSEKEGQAMGASIVVLPFADLSPGRDNEYFSDGITEEIIAGLSKLGSLRVVSRTSVMRLKNTSSDIQAIRNMFNVRYVLEGSVRKAGNALRITAQLIDTTNDTHLWGETYPGTLDDVFDIQERVARQIADALRLRLSPSEKVILGKRSTDDPEAFDANLRARAHLKAGTKQDVLRAIELFKDALSRDTRYAAAYAGLAEAYATWFEFYEHEPKWLELSVESGLKALMYDADLAEAYAALGLAYFNKGALDDAVMACRRAIALDADNFVGYWILSRLDYVTGRRSEAIEMLNRVIALDPDYYPAYFTLRMVYQELGDKTYIDQILTRVVEDILPRYLQAHPEDARARNAYGTELTHAGRAAQGRAEVEKALEQSPDDPLILYATACYEAMWGEKHVALDLLKRAVAAGYLNFDYMRRDSDLKSLHGEPEYEALVRRQPRE